MGRRSGQRPTEQGSSCPDATLLQERSAGTLALYTLRDDAQAERLGQSHHRPDGREVVGA